MTEWTRSAKHKATDDPARCCALVSDRFTNWPRYYQCSKPRGHGPEQAYCKVHDPAAKAAKEAARDAKYRAEYEASDRRRAIGILGSGMIDALRKIADGSPSPRPALDRHGRYSF